MADKTINIKVNVNDDGKIDKLNAEADKLGKKTIEPTLNTKKIDDFILNLTGDPIKVAFDGDFGDITKQLEQLKKELRAITGRNESKVKIPIAIEGIDQLLEKLDSLKLSLKDIISYLGMKDIRKPEVIDTELNYYKDLQKQIESARDSAKELFQSKIRLDSGELVNNRRGFQGDNAKNYIETLFGDPDSLKNVTTSSETILKYINQIKEAGFDLSKIEVGKSGKNFTGLHSLLDVLNKIAEVDPSAFDKYKSSFEEIIGSMSKVDLSKQTASIKQQIEELEAAGGDVSKIRELTSEYERLQSVQAYEPKSSIADNKSYEELLQILKDLNEEYNKAVSMGQGALRVGLDAGTLNQLKQVLADLSKFSVSVGKVHFEDGQTFGINPETLNRITQSIESVKNEITSVTEKLNNLLAPLQDNSKPIDIKVDVKDALDKIGNIKGAVESLPTEKTIKISVDDNNKLLENQSKNVQKPIQEEIKKPTQKNNNEQPDVTINVDNKSALESISSVKKELDGLQDKNISVSVDVNNLDGIQTLKSSLEDITKTLEGIPSKIPDVSSSVSSSVSSAEVKAREQQVIQTIDTSNVDTQIKKNEELVESYNEVTEAVQATHNVVEATETIKTEEVVTNNVANLVPDTSAIEKAASDFELLTHYINGYIEAQEKLKSGNHRIVQELENGQSIYTSSDDYRQGKLTQASVKRALGEFIDHHQQATTGLQDIGTEKIKLTEENINFHKNAADKALDKLAARVYAFKDMETAATLFGKKNAEVFDEVQRRIENAKVAFEGRKDIASYRSFLNDQLLNSYGIDSTSGQMDQIVDSIKTGGIEGFASKVEELFGVKIPTSIEQAKASIAGLDLGNTSISPDAVNNTADAYNNLADSATKAGEAISNIQASTSELTLADDTISHIIPEDIAEKARQQIDEIKGHINTLLKVDIPRSDSNGILSQYLLGENGAKTSQQLVDEIQNEIIAIQRTIADSMKSSSGMPMSREDRLSLFDTVFEKLNAAQAFGLINYDYKKSFGKENNAIEFYYDAWKKQNSSWEQFMNSLNDDDFSAFGNLFDYSNSLSVMQKNGGQDYIDYLTQLTTLSEQAKKVISDNKNRQQVDFSTMNISTEDAQSTAQGLLQEKEAIDGLINSIREFQSKNKVFEFSDMQLGNEDFISKLYSLQDISKLLEETADNYERLNVKQQGFQRDIFDNVIDKTLKQETEIPKELENYADQLWDKITSPSDKGLSGQEAIDMFNQKAKELGVTFDELSNKWVQISSIEQPNIQDTGSQLEQEAEAREHVAETASHQAEQITNVNSVEGTSTTTVDTSSIDNLTNVNLEATESANQLAEAQQRANEVASSESSVSSKIGEYEQLAEAANQATEAEANVSKPVEVPQDVSSLVEQMTALAEQLNSQTQALQRQASEVQNIVSTEQESFSNLANTITEITEKYSQFSQEIAKITQTENTATTYQASPIENVEQLTTAYQTLSKAILEAQEAQSKLTSLSTETVDAEGTKSTVSYVSQFSELGTVISDIARDVNGLSAFISKVNEATSNNGISDYSQTVNSLSNALANLKEEDITRINDLSLKLGQLVSITPDSISGVLNSIKVNSTASQNIELLAAAFDKLKTALSGFSGDSNFASTIQPLTELLSRSTQLQNLADILKESESKIKAVKEKVGTRETDISDRQAEEYKKLTDAVNKYAEAKKVLDSGAGTVSKQQLAEYKQAMDTQEEYISKVGLYNEKMQEASMKPISTQNLKDVQTAENVLSKVYSYLDENKNVSGFESQFQNLKQQADTLKETVVSVKDNISDISSENLKQLSNDLSKAFSQTSSAALKETGISSALENAKEVVELNSQSTFQPMVDQLALVNDKIKETEDLLNSLDLKNLSDVDISNITAKADELRDLYAQTQSSQFAPVNEEYRANVLSSLDNWLNTNAQAADTYRERIEALKTTVQEAQNQLQVESADYDLHQIQMQYDSDEANKIATREAKYKELAEAVQEYAKASLDANKKIISGKGADVDFDRIQQLKKAYEDLSNEIKNNKDLYDSEKHAEAMQPVISLGDDIQKIRERVQATKDLSEARKILKDTDAYIEKNPFKEGTREYNALEETRKKVEELRNALNDLKSDTDTNGIRVLASDTKQSLLEAQQAIKNINQQGKERLNEIGVSQALSRANAFIAQNQGTEFEPMIQQLSEVQSKAQNVSDILRNLDVNNASREEIQSLIDAVSELNAAVNKGKTEQFIPADMNKYQKALSSFEAFLNGNPLAAQTYANEVEYLRQALEDAAKSGSQFDLNSVIAQMDAFKAKALEAGNVGESFGQKLAKTFSGLGRYLATYVSFYRIVGVIKDAIKTVRELDTAFKDIRMVSSESMKTISDYQKESFKMADQIGSNAIDLQKSTAQWVRLGYDFNEAAEASQASSWLVNVSEFDNIDDATTALVSMKAAYDDLDFTSILDKLNAIGDSFSSSTDQLASGLQNSAAVLKLQGNDIDQALALLTAGNDVTQDMSKTSAGVRTIALRIAGLLPENMATY